MRGVAVTLACFALIAVLLAWSRGLTRRRFASLGHATLAVACAAVAACLWWLANGLGSYEPIQSDVPIAELRFDGAGPGRFRATLIRLPAGRVQIFEMAGERWRIVARTLEWLGPAAETGLRPAYRLERLESGPATGPATRGYALADATGADVWSRVRGSASWSRYTAAGAAGTPWQPMASGAEYAVLIAGGRLVVEPAGDSVPMLAPRPR